MGDLEKAHGQAIRERKAAEEKAAKTLQNLRALDSKLQHGDRQSSDLVADKQRIEEELQEERAQHAADLSERDFAMNQTQITYQSTSRYLHIQLLP